ncbi:glucoamylase family protein [Undibacterium sp. Di27W]|uniref:glucoamylase family protein n=1 Tax=Undibacterium sp. Di27W TaxID=3413036 RepID=UPI003BF384E1
MDDANLLTSLQRDSFDYFIHEVNPANGLIRDKTADNWPASIAAVGMALTVYTIGVERGFMSRAHAAQRTLTTLQFFAESEQGTGVNATGYKGFYYHFLDMETGHRAWDCELSSIDTGLLLGGVLTSAQYFTQDNAVEQKIRELADMLYRRADWQWMLAGSQLICHGWKPDTGFLQWHWEGYDEALILYLLALGSPTFPIGPESYAAWTTSYEWKCIYDVEYLYAGPLFIHQMSHLWVDFRNIRDDFMRTHDADYFENSRRATLIQQQYAIKNPMGFEQYNALCWGVTASDGPGNLVKKIRGVERVFFDYVARGAPFGPDDGTLAPWAVAACLPFAPEIVLPSISHFQHLRLREVNPYGFKASFSPTFQAEEPHKAGWVSPYHFGINEGPTVIMIENHLHDFPWKMMRENPYIQAGLISAGFDGGWLAAARKTSVQNGSTANTGQASNNIEKANPSVSSEGEKI